MGTFAQKQNHPQISSPLRHSAIHLQRSPGNQAVPPSPSLTSDGGLAMDSSAATTRFAHDFSRIPACGKAPATIQTGNSALRALRNFAVQRSLKKLNLTLSSPGDPREQEAEQISDRVMRMESPGEAPVSGVVPHSKGALLGMESGHR